MTTILNRCRSVLRKHYGVFFLNLLIQSCLVCMLAQVFLAYCCLGNWENLRTKDEATVFLDAKVSSADKSKISSEIKLLIPGSIVKELEAKNLLEGKLTELVKNKNFMPGVLQLQFPDKSDLPLISEAVDKIKKMKGVTAVAADLSWMEQRRNVHRGTVLGALILALPFLLFTILSFGQGASRMGALFKREISILTMLGGRGKEVWGPFITAEFINWIYSFLLGIAFFLIIVFLGLPIIFEALELPHFIFAEDYLLTLGGTALVSAACVFAFAVFEIRRVKTWTFSGKME